MCGMLWTISKDESVEVEVRGMLVLPLLATTSCPSVGNGNDSTESCSADEGGIGTDIGVVSVGEVSEIENRLDNKGLCIMCDCGRAREGGFLAGELCDDLRMRERGWDNDNPCRDRDLRDGL